MDSLRLNPKLERMDRAFESRLFRATYMGVPLIAGGLIVKHQDTKFRRLRNDFLPHFRRPIDDYMQYLPAAVMVGMKTAGVPSRSSWGRMLLSDAFTVGAMAITVDGLKRTTQVTRPDGTNRHSFPSGHTATAFMTATMLTKEYGHLSPWVGVGAYSLATATGLMRVANNKHWISDVMVGAGIGILSTELGYWLADLVMKDK
ncbi:MAG: phosphatase PAP2 family protein, partial [Prevotella sp.]